MSPSPCSLAEHFRPVGLAALQAEAALLDRVDTKYLVPLADLATLAERLRPTHAVLEIEGRRTFRYRTTYFDTADLALFRAHIQQRRRRYKCRAREYVDSGLCAFEVKLKGLRGRTVKHRMDYDPACRDELSGAALAFLRERLAAAYGHEPDPGLIAALSVAYTRVTLASPERGERLTCDFDLVLRAPGGASGRLAPGVVIVESKSPRGDALADRLLRELGVRPVSGCSKYCLGIGATRPGARSNALRPLLRRHFEISQGHEDALTPPSRTPHPSRGQWVPSSHSREGGHHGSPFVQGHQRRLAPLGRPQPRHRDQPASPSPSPSSAPQPLPQPEHQQLTVTLPAGPGEGRR